MGKRHFEHMYEAAAALDAQVLPWAVLRFQEANMAKAAQGDKECLPPFWDMPFDQIMQLSRGLAHIDNEFSGTLIEMIANGRIGLRLLDIFGKLHKVSDPQLLIYDEPRVLRKAFFDYMMNFPPESYFQKQEDGQEAPSAN